MQDLIGVIKFIEAYYSAITRGLENAVALLPLTVEQHIQTQAKQKLHTGLDAYLDALSVKIENYVLVMEIDDDNWLASAMEEGADSFSMKKRLATSAKAKMSRDGYRYMVIPIGKEKGGYAGTDKAKKIQQKINEVMKRPALGPRKLYTVIGGQYQGGVIPNSGPVVESQKIITNDPDISGLYRTRAFSDAAKFHEKQATKKGMPKWNLVMFRVMSEKPGSAAWIHPGIEGRRLLRQTKYFFANILDEFISGHIQQELDKLKGSGSRAV